MAAGQVTESCLLTQTKEGKSEHLSGPLPNLPYHTVLASHLRPTWNEMEPALGPDCPVLSPTATSACEPQAASRGGRKATLCPCELSSNWPYLWSLCGDGLVGSGVCAGVSFLKERCNLAHMNFYSECDLPRDLETGAGSKTSLFSSEKHQGYSNPSMQGHRFLLGSFMQCLLGP